MNDDLQYNVFIVQVLEDQNQLGDETIANQRKLGPIYDRSSSEKIDLEHQIYRGSELQQNSWGQIKLQISNMDSYVNIKKLTMG